MKADASGGPRIMKQCQNHPNESQYTNTQLFSFLLLYRSLPLLIPAILHILVPTALSLIPFLPKDTIYAITPSWNVQTYFQPDEFWQALEPAHKLVFGTGHLTWEWKDLPGAVREDVINDAHGAVEVVATGESAAWKSWILRAESTLLDLTSRLMQEPTTAFVSDPPDGLASIERTVGNESGGRLRGWLWPAIFAGIYWVLKFLRVDDTILIIIAPRIVGVLVAAATDYYTYQLAYRLLGPSGSNAAVFLSMTNLFHAHALPRSLSTSPETFLTVLALSYWPFQDPTGSQDIRKGKAEKPSSDIDKDMSIPVTATIDSLKPNLPFALFAAAVGFVLRPTNGIFWSVMGGELVLRRMKEGGVGSGMKVMGLATLIGFATLLASTILDYLVTGKIYLPILSFFSQNIVHDISSFYGRSAWHFHFTQSLPILLGTSIVWAQDGRTGKDDGAPLRILAIASGVTVLAFSAIPHKEWRFLHPILPILLIFAAARLTSGFEVPEGGLLASRRVSISTWLKIPYSRWTWLWRGTLVSAVAWLYLTGFHGRGQVACMERIREDVARSRITGEAVRVVALMPCHSTPWMSHAHPRSEDAGQGGSDWKFLTCEPPLGNPVNYTTEANRFYADPVEVFMRDIIMPVPPTHLLFFGELLNRRASSVEESTFGDVLRKTGYEANQVWWNGFDVLQDESERRGGVHLWTMTRTASIIRQEAMDVGERNVVPSSA